MPRERADAHAEHQQRRPAAPRGSPADAAPNTAAHDAIVNGFDTVATRPVRNAARGVTVSSGSSAPSRTRHAVRNVRAPSTSSTAAPRSPSRTRSSRIASNGATPAAPRAA